LVTLLLIKAIQLKQQDCELGSLLDGLKEPVESTEIRLPILTKQFAQTGKLVIEHMMDYSTRQPAWHIAPDNREGVRISFDLDGGLNNGWFLLRLSVHDPVMPLNIESDVAGGVKLILQELNTALAHAEGIDLTPLKAAL
jgi:phosphomannomutase